MVAVPCIDGTDQREALEHGGHERQMLANADAGQFGGAGGEGTAVLQRPIRFGIPSIDVARTAGHPQENDALAISGVSTPGSGAGAAAQQLLQTETGQSGQTRLEHVAPAAQRQTFALERVEITESVR